MVILSLIMVFVFSAPCLWAQPQASLLISDIEGKEILPENLYREMQKVLLRRAALQKSYQLVLGEVEIKTEGLNYASLKAQVKKSQDGTFFLSSELFDHKKKILIKKLFKDQVRQDDVLRIFEAMIESIFIKDIPNKSKAQKQTNRPDPNRPKDIIAVNNPDRSQVDLKKIIQGLKSDTDEAIIEKVAAEESDSEDSKKKRKKAKPDNKPTPRPTPILASNLEKEIASRRPFFSTPIFYDVGLGWEQRTMNTEGLISTTSTARSIAVNFDAHKAIHPKLQTISFGVDGQLVQVMSFPYQTSIPYSLSFFIQSHFLNDQLRVSIKGKKDRSFFVGLVGPGLGLEAFDITSDWLELQIYGSVKNWKSKVSFSKLLQSNTSYKYVTPNQWEGNSYSLSLTPPIHIKQWYTSFEVKNIQLESKGVLPLKSAESRFLISLMRYF